MFRWLYQIGVEVFSQRVAQLEQAVDLSQRAFEAMRQERDDVAQVALTYERQVAVLRRQIAALTAHPCAVNGWLSGTPFVAGRVAGGDDETLAQQRRGSA